jgi:hypothetical protein
MDDIFLQGVVGDSVYFVTPLSHSLYRQAHGQGLGGSEGYFICSASESRRDAGFEILAKAASFEAAEQIFLALTRPAANRT